MPAPLGHMSSLRRQLQAFQHRQHLLHWYRIVPVHLYSQTHSLQTSHRPHSPITPPALKISTGQLYLLNFPNSAPDLKADPTLPTPHRRTGVLRHLYLPVITSLITPFTGHNLTSQLRHPIIMTPITIALLHSWRARRSRGGHHRSKPLYVHLQ